MTRPSNDSDLLSRVALQDAEAFEALYELYSPIAYGLLLRILRDPEDASEALQETFVQIWNRASMFDASRGNEIAWIISIARSRGIDRLRSRNTRDQKQKDAATEISLGVPSVHRAESSEMLLLKEKQEAVRAALAELPEAQRITLEMSYFGGLSQTEISSHTGEPLGTIKTRMQLGMKKLRSRLETFKT